MCPPPPSSPSFHQNCRNFLHWPSGLRRVFASVCSLFSLKWNKNKPAEGNSIKIRFDRPRKNLIFFKERLPFKSPDARIPYHPTPIESSNWNHPGLPYICVVLFALLNSTRILSGVFSSILPMHNDFFTVYFQVLCFMLWFLRFWKALGLLLRGFFVHQAQ